MKLSFIQYETMGSFFSFIFILLLFIFGLKETLNFLWELR